MQLKHYFRLGIRGVALFLALVLLDTTCSAQTPIDVTIIVDGAWAYVPDPANTADRIIAIAPGTAPYHRNGIDVTPKPKPDGSPIPVGSYNLEIPNYKFSQCTSNFVRCCSLSHRRKRSCRSECHHCQEHEICFLFTKTLLLQVQGP